MTATAAPQLATRPAALCPPDRQLDLEPLLVDLDVGECPTPTWGLDSAPSVRPEVVGT